MLNPAIDGQVSRTCYVLSGRIGVFGIESIRVEVCRRGVLQDRELIELFPGIVRLIGVRAIPARHSVGSIRVFSHSTSLHRKIWLLRPDGAASRPPPRYLQMRVKPLSNYSYSLMLLVLRLPETGPKALSRWCRTTIRELRPWGLNRCSRSSAPARGASLHRETRGERYVSSDMILFRRILNVPNCGLGRRHAIVSWDGLSNRQERWEDRLVMPYSFDQFCADCHDAVAADAGPAGRVVRVTGCDLDKIPKLRFDRKSGKALRWLEGSSGS